MFIVPGNPERSPRHDAFDVASEMVRADGYATTPCLNGTNLLEDTHMAAAIGEKGSWGDDENVKGRPFSSFLTTHEQPPVPRTPA